jgi:integrase/recombinase XerD
MGMPRKAKKDIAYLTEQEIDAFFRVIRDPRDKVLFRVMYHHGLRASEPGKLRLFDYRPGPGRPRLRVVRLKGISGVEHELVDVAITAVKAWLRVRGSVPGPLFRSRKQGPLKRVQIYKVMRRYCILAAVPLDKTHPHALKHSCVTHLSQLLNGNLIEVQDHVGHADPRSIMRYLRATQRNTRRVAGGLGEALGSCRRALPPCLPVVAGEQH